MVNVEKKERKKRYDNDIERIQAVRTTKAKWQQGYRDRLRLKKEKEKLKFTNKSYQSDIYNNIKDLNFNRRCTLRFNRFTKIEYAETAVQYFIKRLTTGFDNVCYTFQRGADRNIHIHLAFQFTKEFLALYTNREQIEKYLHSIWNNDNAKNGAVWCKPFNDEKHKKNYLKYIFRDVLPQSQLHFKQKEVDLYYIQSVTNVNTNVNAGLSTYITSLNTLLNETNISSLGECYIVDSKLILKQKIMPHNSLKSLIKKYKHQAITMAIAAVWLLMI